MTRYYNRKPEHGNSETDSEQTSEHDGLNQNASENLF
jgi:hypothetical protein